jgi:Phage T4 tail fibre
MKNTIKLLYLGLFLFGITATRAQISTSTGESSILSNTPNTNTNVGIGTTSPYTKLEVAGVISSGAGPGANNLGIEFGGLLEPSALPSQIRGVIGALNSGTGVSAGSIGYQPRTGVNASHIFFNERVETFRITSTGNVGIGTPLPIVKLDLGGTTDQDIGVKTALSNYAFYGAWQDEAIIAVNRRPSNGTFTQTTKGAASINLNSNTSGSYIKFTTNNIVNTLGVERMRIVENGNVGIGTTTPTEKLVVNGDGARIKIETSSSPSSYYAYLESKYDAANPFNIVVQGTQMFGAKNIGIGSTPDTYVSGYYGIAFATQTTTAENANVRMYINQAGNVGIGTTHPDEKLTVKGKIHAEEIKVDLAVPADYVFQKYYTGKSELKSDYAMPTLAEIESFTKENHHLPNVPSAKEIQQNGLPLGEMSNVLLQKIEELTLYAIEQDKKAELQQQELERLKTENEKYKSLSERLSVIEKELKK